MESCCILTTDANKLIKQIHNRMPVIIQNGLEEEWIGGSKEPSKLKALEPLLTMWNPSNWLLEQIKHNSHYQTSLF